MSCKLLKSLDLKNTWQKKSVKLHFGVMVIKTEKIGKFSVWTDQDPKGRLTKTVYFDYRPVASFNPDNIKERRLE